MQKFSFQSDLEETKMFIAEVLARHLPESSFSWLNSTATQISNSTDERIFHFAFSALTRFTGKDKLEITSKDITRAESIRGGWNLKNWTLDQAGRTLLILSLPNENPENFKNILDQATVSANVTEAVALYSSLPLLPHPETHCERATLGIRNNMTSVFDAVALDNPYPADFLNESAWNQLILKAVFNNRPLNRIINIDYRSNAALADMLCSYAHERWAAGRTVTPELWRSVGPFINDSILPDIEKVFQQDNPLEHQAAALACQQSSFAPAKDLLDKRGDLKKDIEQNKLNWQLLADKLDIN